MSPRRTGLPTFSPSSVIIEFHEFAGHWFVTDRLGAGYGALVQRPIKKTALGKAVLDRVESARSEWRSFVSPADDAAHWEQFCVTEAGVPADQYQPEKRLVILAGKTGIQCHDASQSPPNWQPLPSKSPRALGKALLAYIDALQPTVPQA